MYNTVNLGTNKNMGYYNEVDFSQDWSIINGATLSIFEVQ